MKTLVLEYFDVFNKKHFIKLPYDLKDKVLKEGLKVDASDVLGLHFVCEAEFILLPVVHSLREIQDKEVYLCRIYDEEKNLIDLKYWYSKAIEELEKLGNMFFDKKYINNLNVKPLFV